MIVVVLSWLEPDQGAHAILFPDAAKADLRKVTKWVEKQAGDEYGNTIARIDLVQKWLPPDDGESGAWEDLALNIRYSSGEELYEKDCPMLKKHGVERS